MDAANVVGSRPDGWWRDRAGAATRLLGQIAAGVRAGRLDPPVTVILEGRARSADASQAVEGMSVELAPGSGDDAIVDRVAEAGAAGQAIVVVTADRGLAARVRSLGADVWSPARLLDLLA